MKSVIALSGVLVFLISAGCAKKAEESAGKDIPNSAKIVFSVGEVTILDSSGTTPAQPEMVLPVGSTIVTAVRSQCNVLIGDSSYISVKENSRLVLESLTKKGGALEASTLDLQRGRIVATPKKLLRGEGFNIKTPTAVAAVRGTKFVVSSEAGEDVRISVIEGKVEMKPRVAVLEETYGSSGTEAAVQDLQRKVDQAAIIVGENQTASINTASAQALSAVMTSAVSDIKKSSESALAKVKAPEIPPAVMASIVKSVADAGISMDQKVTVEAKEEVKELDALIVDDQKKQDAAEKITGVLTISTPIKNSLIRLNGRLVGYGAATVRVDAGQTLTVDIKAKEFEDYHTELTIAKEETKLLDIALVRTKRMDRVAWSNSIGSGIKGDLVFYNGMIVAASSEGALVCMDRSGSVVWRTALAGGLDSTPAIAGGKVFAVTKNEKLHALDAKNGKELWKADISGSLVFGSSPLVLDENVVVASSSGKVYSFAFDGTRNWLTDIGAGIYATPSRNSNVIYIGADDHKLYALKLKNGNIEWNARLDSRIVSSAPVVNNGKIFIGTYNGTLYCLTPDKGSVVWSFKTGGAIVSAPVCFNDRVYVGSKDAKLYAVSAAAGTAAWSISTGQPVSAEVSILGNELYAAAGRTVYSIDFASGRVNWSYELEGNASSVIADGTGVFVGVGGRLVSLRTDIKDIVR
jgi:outer membrane protein assembly factor BamB